MVKENVENRREKEREKESKNSTGSRVCKKKIKISSDTNLLK